ncbi:hypothetical protein [Halapricum desulfuricans]|nr:hypothetical protein [Halapricum desulfuricans]
MQVYHSKTTREDKPAPEIRWIVGENIRIIGFDEFKYQIRLTIVRLDGESCAVSDERTSEFFTEVPATTDLKPVVNDTEVHIDTESLQSHLIVNSGDLQYKIEKIPGSEPLDFRQQYLPISQPIAEGSIPAKKLYQYVKMAPSENLQVKISDQAVEFISESSFDELRWGSTEASTVHIKNTERTYLFDVNLLYDTVKRIPDNKMLQFFVTEESIKFRYELGNIGYVNYYQRTKSSSDTFVI